MRERKLPTADLGDFGAGFESEGGKRELPSVAMVGGRGGGREMEGEGRRRQESEGVGDDTASQIPRQVSIDVPG